MSSPSNTSSSAAVPVKRPKLVTTTIAPTPIVRDAAAADQEIKKLKLMEHFSTAATASTALSKLTAPRMGFEKTVPRLPAPPLQEAQELTMDRAIFDANVSGDFRGLVKLVYAGASANAQREQADRSTGLIAAVRWGNLQAAKFMLDHGANVLQKDVHNKSAMIHAREIHDLVLRDQMLELLSRYYLHDYAGEEEEEEEEEEREVGKLRRMFDYQSLDHMQQQQQCVGGSCGIRSRRQSSDDDEEEEDSSEEEREFRCCLGDDEEEEEEEATLIGRNSERNYFFDDDDSD